MLSGDSCYGKIEQGKRKVAAGVGGALCNITSVVSIDLLGPVRDENERRLGVR